MSIESDKLLARISEDETRKQTIIDHLLGTAELAGRFANAFNNRELGYACGLLHDIGKYSQGFQRRLRGGPKVDHATAGAKEASNYASEMGYVASFCAQYCISGHHSGLLDFGTASDVGGTPTLKGRLNKRLDDYQAYKQEIEIPKVSRIPLKSLDNQGFSAAFLIRMIFSCLVDADRLDTERFMSNGAVQRGGYDSMLTLFERLNNKVRPWLENGDLNTVNGRRTAILKACLDKGRSARGLFTLTVPTGGGKTISSLAFALQHAVENGMERIIYVIPYTSIIEQNAGVFKDILGEINVLEHHSNVTYKKGGDEGDELDLKQLAAENWDMPVIVTTNVQFFESLFSNGTSKCRKIHNIANSVIIFDEAQMLPTQYLKPCLQAIAELVYNYRSTAVICTATQPALEKFFPEALEPVEICPEPAGQYEFFRRTSIKHIGEISEEELIERLKQRDQALCILNSRKRVQRVYDALGGEGTYHLSTFMYPAHRSRILAEIKARLKDKKPCRLIATSLVEAGVDLDFRAVFRELAGVDSLIQAAGRCNREGEEDRYECETIVFSLTKTEGINIPRSLEMPIDVTKQIVEAHGDVMSLEAIKDYFERLYKYKGENGLDLKGVLNNFKKGLLIPFASVADKFKLIEENTKPVFIEPTPIDEDSQKAADIAKRLRSGEHTRSLTRDAGQYSVNIYESDFETLRGAGLLEEPRLEIYILRDKRLYSKDKGLILNVSRGDALVF